MRINGFTMSIVVAATVAVLSGCSSGAQNANSAVPNVLAPHAGGAAVSQHDVKTPHSAVPRDLYVASNANAVQVFRNKTYREVGAITNGVAGPTDLFTDKQGNLYVANSGGNITEYAPGNFSAPSFTYTAGMTEPIAVTADTQGNVYEADYSGAVVNQYFQGFNYVLQSCPVSGFPVGVAVDSSGDVFLLINTTGSGPLELAEYPGGLSNCAGETILGAPVSGLYDGIAIDANKNLVLANDSNVEVIDPPYTSVTRTIGSGFSGAINVKLNKKNTLAFVADYGNNTVTIVNYVTGANVTVLGRANGVVSPRAVVDWPNAVY